MIALRVVLAVVSILLALLLVNPAINDAAALNDPDNEGSVVMSWLGIVLVSGIMWACVYGAVFGW